MKLFGLAALIVVLFDQLSKIWIRRNLPFGDTIDVLPGWVHLSHSLNTGAAWGMLSGMRWILILVSIGVSVFIIKTARDLQGQGRLPQVALGMIFGGAIGNLIDRVLFGAVTDMIDMDTPLEFLRTFPIFNLADSALTAGVILLMLHFILHPQADNPQSAIQNPQSNHAPDSL